MARAKPSTPVISRLIWMVPTAEISSARNIKHPLVPQQRHRHPSTRSYAERADEPPEVDTVATVRWRSSLPRYGGKNLVEVSHIHAREQYPSCERLPVGKNPTVWCAPCEGRRIVPCERPILCRRRNGPVQFGVLGGWITVRCPRDYDSLMRNAGGQWELNPAAG